MLIGTGNDHELCRREGSGPSSKLLAPSVQGIPVAVSYSCEYRDVLGFTPSHIRAPVPFGLFILTYNRFPIALVSINIKNPRYLAVILHPPLKGVVLE
jgi:hypothetical protein